MYVSIPLSLYLSIHHFTSIYSLYSQIRVWLTLIPEKKKKKKKGQKVKHKSVLPYTLQVRILLLKKIQSSMFVITREGCGLWHLVKVQIHPLEKPSNAPLQNSMHFYHAPTRSPLLASHLQPCIPEYFSHYLFIYYAAYPPFTTTYFTLKYFCHVRMGSSLLTERYLIKRRRVPDCKNCLVPQAFKCLLVQCPSLEDCGNRFLTEWQNKVGWYRLEMKLEGF